MKKLFIILSVLIVAASTGCGDKQQFDSNIWKEQGLDWHLTDVRENMLDDLLESDTLIGIHMSEIIYLLGEPEEMKNEEYKYLVREKYGSNIDPEYIKYLSIEFDENGKTINLEIVE
ncbi:MAG: hypothetical protein COB15_00920 [Flavobacteriales bacterium]|nr:MAG: hypothetical protein COB15_00920 [Flavobacteriales bacterium]